MFCYHCKGEIDDDSLFCDLCGTKIYICPECHIPGKGEGKRCGFCGKPLVEAASLSARPIERAPAPVDDLEERLIQLFKETPFSIPKPSFTPTPKAPTRLVCRSEGVTLELVDGAVIGRHEGIYSSQLAELKFISSRHASIHKEGNKWIITDLGSRNGTAVNGQWCYSPLPFQVADTVRLANYYDFVAE